MLYKDFIRNKSHHLAKVKIESAEGCPCEFTNSRGKTLKSIKMYGRAVQNGTPEMTAPIEIQSVGDLITDSASEYFGQYKVPITISDGNLSENTFSVYLDAPLYGMGKIFDTVELKPKTGTAKLHRRFTTVCFDGGEDWTLYTSNGKNNYLSKLNNALYANSVYPKAMSNFIPLTDKIQTEAGKYGFHINSVSQIGIYTDNSSLADFKAWLASQKESGNPVTVTYAMMLSTTAAVDISDKINWNSIPKTYKGTNIITAETAITPSNIEVKYIAE